MGFRDATLLLKSAVMAQSELHVDQDAQHGEQHQVEPMSSKNGDTPLIRTLQAVSYSNGVRH